MKIAYVASSLLLCGSVPSSLGAVMPVYKATLNALSGFSAKGTAVVFIEKDGKVGYTGSVENVEANLTWMDCAAPNGCGAHVHEGTSCFNSTLQGGHYYQNPPVTSDPWEFERYTSNAAGKGYFGNVINIGTADVAGRAFIVHDSLGTRIACGLLEPVPTEKLYKATTEPLSGSNVTGQVTVYNPGTGVVYLSGSGKGLEKDLLGPPNGTDCRATNGCGDHIHEGFSCFNTTLQGGHLYNKQTLSSDPWALIRYPSTSSAGEAYFAHCVDQQESAIDGRAYIIHNNAGGRVSCGLLAPVTGGTTTSSGVTAIFRLVVPIISSVMAIVGLAV